MEGKAVVDSDLLPLLYPADRRQRADQPKPGVVNSGPAAVWREAVVCLVGESSAVVVGVLCRARDVDVAGRGEVDSDKNKSNV